MGLVDTSKVDKLDVPHEGGQWIEIRALLATEMDEAKEVRLKRLMDMWGGNLPSVSEQKGAWAKPAILKALNDAFAPVDLPPEVEQAVTKALGDLPTEEPETLAQRVAQYDALTLLKHAVVSWSYDVPVKSGSLDHVELLDAATRDWLVGEIVERNTRPLASGRSSNGSSKWGNAHQSSPISTPSEEPESP